MSRGFGSTFGTGSPNYLLGKGINVAAQFSCLIWYYSHGAGGTGFGFPWAIGNSNANLQCGLVNNSSATSILFARAWSVTSGSWGFTIAADTWTPILVTYDGSSTANDPIIYINGLPATVSRNSAPSGTITPANFNFVVSGMSSLQSHNIDGMAAHVAFWNGIILDSSEAMTLSNGVNPTNIRPDSLSLYWPMDGINRPEIDIVNGVVNTIVGTSLGRSEPPVMPILYDYPHIFDPIPPAPDAVATVIGGGADDSWRKYLTWIMKRKRSEFKRKAPKVGLQEIAAVKILEIANQQVLKNNDILKASFTDVFDDGEIAARAAVSESIQSVYDEVWKQMAVQKREITDLKINIKKKQEGDEEDDVFLMVM